RGDTLERRLKRRNVVRGFDENKHRAESHRDDENRGQDGGENHFHKGGATHRNRRRKDSATGCKSECDSGEKGKSVKALDESTETQRKPDQSSATRMESLGFEGSYFTLAG